MADAVVTPVISDTAIIGILIVLKLGNRVLHHP